MLTRTRSACTPPRYNLRSGARARCRGGGGPRLLRLGPLRGRGGHPRPGDETRRGQTHGPRGQHQTTRRPTASDETEEASESARDSPQRAAWPRSQVEEQLDRRALKVNRRPVCSSSPPRPLTHPQWSARAYTRTFPPPRCRAGHRGMGGDDRLTRLSAWGAESPVSTLENLDSRKATQARLTLVSMHCLSPSA